MVDDKNVANVVSLACCEIAQDKVVAAEGDQEVVVPITREERIRREEEQKERERRAEEARLEREAAYSAVPEAEDGEEKADDSALDSLLATVTGNIEEDGEFDDEDVEPTEEDLIDSDEE